MNRTILMCVMDGSLDLRTSESPDYIFIGSGAVDIRRNGKSLVKVLAPKTVNLALKSKEGSDIENASEIYITFFRPVSCSVPVDLSVGGAVKYIEACDMNGRSLGRISFKTDNGISTFRSSYEDREPISYYKVTR